MITLGRKHRPGTKVYYLDAGKKCYGRVLPLAEQIKYLEKQVRPFQKKSTREVAVVCKWYGDSGPGWMPEAQVFRAPEKKNHMHPLAVATVRLKEQLARAGLVRTAAHMDAVVKEIGYEITESIGEQRWREAESYYFKNRKAVHKIVRDDDKQHGRNTFSFPPSLNFAFPINWNAAHWRWFLSEYRKRRKATRQRMRRKIDSYRVKEQHG